MAVAAAAALPGQAAPAGPLLRPRRPRAPRSAQAALSRHIAHRHRHPHRHRFRAPSGAERDAAGRFGAVRGGAGPLGSPPGGSRHGNARRGCCTMVAVDAGFPRSPRGALKLGRMVGSGRLRPLRLPATCGAPRAELAAGLLGARPAAGSSPGCPLIPSRLFPQLVAFVAFVCFVASRAHEAYAALVIIEFIIPLLFFLLYLLKLDKKMTKLYWPLAVSIGSRSR